MIAKKTSLKKCSSAKALAKYIASAKEKGEKLDQFWLSNCKAGVDIDDLGHDHRGDPRDAGLEFSQQVRSELPLGGVICRR